MNLLTFFLLAPWHYSKSLNEKTLNQKWCSQLERQEAIEILKAILDKCPRLDGNPICLMPSETNLLAEGYQIHITSTICDEAKQYLMELLANRGIEYREGKERFMIFKPSKTRLL